MCGWGNCIADALIGSSSCYRHWSLPSPLLGDSEPPQKVSEPSQQGAQLALMLSHCQSLSSIIKMSLYCPHCEIHLSVTFKLQRARKMLINLPVSGGTQDFPINGKGLPYGPCPKGADVKKFAIPHCSIYSLPLLFPNPPKAHRRGAQEQRMLHSVTKGWGNGTMCLSQAENTVGNSKLDYGSSYSNTRVFLPLCRGKLRHVLATAKWLPVICSFSFNESVEWDQCECQGSESLSFSCL